MRRIIKWFLLGFTVLLVGIGAPLVVFGWEAYQLRYPAAVNMGEMSALHGDHLSSSDTGPAVSVTDLKDPVTTAPVKSFQITAQNRRITLDNGEVKQAWTFNGTTPGPELRVQEGDRLRVTLKNEDIEEGVTIHWHGLVLPNSMDGVAGVTQNAVKPGETFTYDFIARHAGTFWFHSHQQSSLQANMGLMGRLIVEPKQKAFSYDRDYAVQLQEFRDYYLVNGKTKGVQLDAHPGEVVRLRLINSDSDTHEMTVVGVPFRVVSMDARDLIGPTELENTYLSIGGGQRYDLLFRMPDSGSVQVTSSAKDKASFFIQLGKGDAAEQPSGDLKEFDFTAYGTPAEDGLAVDSPFDSVHELRLNQSFLYLTINEKAFHEIPPILVAEGDLVKIKLINQGGGDHPMHLHGHTFKVLTKNGKPLTGSPIYLDTILLKHGDTYEIAFRADNPGLWMEHCHRLWHAENGMTMMVNYQGITTPYTVGRESGNFPD